MLRKVPLGSRHLPTKATRTAHALHLRVWTVTLLGMSTTLPLPHGASEKLRNTLASLAAPSPSEYPADLGALKKLIAEEDAVWAANGDAMIKLWNLGLKEEKLAGGRVYHLAPAQVASEHA